MSGLVAIHQPNFLPWLGYFDKIARADVFVLLDDVQFPKKGGTWTNRVKVMVGGEPGWLTVPIVRSYRGLRTIREMEIDESKPWRRRMLATLRQSYGRAPHHEEAGGLVEELIAPEGMDLAAYNELAVRRLAGELGLKTPMVRSSELDVGETATARLIELVRAVDGSAYLAGGGAEGYQEDEQFAAAGVELVPQAFEPPVYPQPVDPPAPGLSILDALMNVGVAGTRELVAAGRP